jgi:creatinine amidohydrolase
MPSTTPPWGRYAELHPDTLAAIQKECPVVYIPWGALDSHGPHLPLGTDGLVAEAVAAQVAQRAGGVLLPTIWWPGSELPRDGLLSVRASVMRELWSDLLDGLAQVGWKVVVAINGYYTQDHEMVLIDVAETAIKQYGLLVLSVPPLALIDQSLLDRAALWETSLLMSIHPNLVDLYALQDEDLQAENNPVKGRDPRGAASPSLGDTVFNLAVDRLTKAVNELLATQDIRPLLALYEKRRERYQMGNNQH